MGGRERMARLAPLLALLVACVSFSIVTSGFLEAGNVSLIVQRTTVIGTLALGQTLVVLTAGIDLSCGAVMAFGSIVMTKLAVDHGVPGVPAILLGVGACLAFGCLNGGLVAWIGLPPFIVTLSTLNIAFALTHIVSNDNTFSGVPGVMTWLGRTFDLGGVAITYGSFVCLGLFALAWLAHGRGAIGPTKGGLLTVYVVAGVLYGVAALLLISHTQVGDPNVGQTETFDAIAAVLLGGTSLFGGRGTIIGTLIGTLFVVVLRNGLVLEGVASVYATLFTAVLVLLVVSVDQLARRRATCTG